MKLFTQYINFDASGLMRNVRITKIKTDGITVVKNTGTNGIHGIKLIINDPISEIITPDNNPSTISTLIFPLLGYINLLLHLWLTFHLD